MLNKIYKPTEFPCGSEISFYINNDHPHYIGLCQLLVFGSKGPVEVINLETTCEAIPEDLRILRNMLDSVKDDSLGSHSWLGIKKPNHNKIVLTTSHQEIYRILLVNYQKNKDRGVKTVDIFIDN